MDGLIQSAAAIETVIVHGGSASAKCDSGGTNLVRSVSTGGAQVDISTTTPTTKIAFVRGYFYFANLPSITTTILRPAFGTFTGAGGTKHVCVRVDTTGHLIANVDDQNSITSTTALITGQWYRIECKVTIQTTATNIIGTVNAVFVDGADFSLTATKSQAGTTISLAPLFGWVLAPGANLICYVDDVAWNDDQGANQNSYPGAGKCVLLVPISTNAVATKWTDNDGTQTNMWQGAANLPPAGIAAATSPSHKYIKHAGGAAGTTDAFDANMKSYSTAGLVAGDTIAVIQFIGTDGEEVTTGTKLLNYEVLSNPVIASPGNVTAGNDGGLQGVYNTGPTWIHHRSAMSYSPSVTLGTSPVMRVRRPETATRVPSVCFMGMYVDYIPVVTSSPKRMRAAVLGV